MPRENSIPGASPTLHPLIQLMMLGDRVSFKKRITEFKNNINDQDEGGVTILHCAACFEDSFFCLELMKYGASDKIKDNEGKTPADYRIQAYQNNEMIKKISAPGVIEYALQFDHAEDDFLSQEADLLG